MSLAIITAPIVASESWLITPNVGLTIWTLVVFAISVFILVKAVFPRITAALDERRRTIEESIDSAARTREEADGVLREYRERLAEARQQSDDIVARARATAEAQEREAQERAREIAREASRRVERDIDAATARALQEIRNEVADLTILATEKVTRKALDASDQRRLVEEALGEIDFSTLSGTARDN